MTARGKKPTNRQRFFRLRFQRQRAPDGAIIRVLARRCTGVQRMNIHNSLKSVLIFVTAIFFVATCHRRCTAEETAIRIVRSRGLFHKASSQRSIVAILRVFFRPVNFLTGSSTPRHGAPHRSSRKDAQPVRGFSRPQLLFSLAGRDHAVLWEQSESGVSFVPTGVNEFSQQKMNEFTNGHQVLKPSGKIPAGFSLLELVGYEISFRTTGLVG